MYFSSFFRYKIELSIEFLIIFIYCSSFLGIYDVDHRNQLKKRPLERFKL